MNAIDPIWSIGPLERSRVGEVRALHATAFPGLETVADTLGDAGVVIGATIGSQLIGYLVARRDRDSVELWEHVVAEPYRGHGVGRSLLYHLIHHLAPDELIIVDPAGLLDDDRIRDYYGSQGFAPISTGEFGAAAAEVDAALASSAHQTSTTS